MSFRKIWVLVIEDDRVSRKLLAVKLRKRAFSVILAENAYKALEILKYCTPDCILLDIMLPEMHGYKFLSQLRQMNNDLPVIIVSRINKHPDLVATFEHLGIKGWFSKPINPDRIAKRIKEVLDQNSTKGKNISSAYSILQ